MKKIIGAGLSLLLAGQGNTYSLKSDQVISIPVFCGSLLRIAVRGDLIQDVVIYPEKLAQKMTLHKSGQLFLDTRNLSHPVTLSLITQRNVTQDMRIYCDDKCQAQPLLLEPEEKLAPPLTIEDPKLSNLIKKAIQGELERGTSLPRDSGRTREEVEWKGKKYWTIDDLLIERYEAKNNTSRVIVLRPETFQEKDDFAISFDRDFLEPNQKAVMVIVRKKEAAEQ